MQLERFYCMFSCALITSSRIQHMSKTQTPPIRVRAKNPKKRNELSSCGRLQFTLRSTQKKLGNAIKCRATAHN